MEIIFGDYKFSDNKNLISLDNVCKLLNKTYWANNRQMEINKKAIENSICIGIYKNNEIIGFSRIVTDYATMYWLADVIIDENHRKNGLGKKLYRNYYSYERTGWIIWNFGNKRRTWII